MDKMLMVISMVISIIALGIAVVMYIRNEMNRKEVSIDIEKKTNKKEKKGFYVFLSVLCIIMIIMAIVSFVLAQPRFIISRGIMFVFATITILLLFDSIDSFSIGNMLSLKTKVKEKEKEVEKLNEENIQLRNQFVSIMTTTLNKQNVFVGCDSDFAVRNADVNADEEDETTQMETCKENSKNNEEVIQTKNNTQKIDRVQLEELMLKRFKESNNILDVDLRRDVKIAHIGVSSDPIIEKDIKYDAYIKRPMDEIFIEITPNMILSSMMEYRLYFMISRVYYYGQANKVKTKLILVIPKFTDEYVLRHFDEMRRPSPMRMVQRFKDIFRPAIQNDLFEIVEIQISDDDIRQIEVF